MEPLVMDLLVDFFDQIDVLMLIFVRVLAFSLVIPVISSMSVPVMVRIFFALASSVAIFTSGIVQGVSYDGSMLGLVYLMVQEFFAGLIMAFMVFIVFNIIFFSGQLIDQQIGFAMANTVDPMNQINNVPMVGNLYYLVMMALLVASGGLHLLLDTFFHSYQVLPIGYAQVFGNAAVAGFALDVMVEFMVIAVRIALPVVGAMLIINAALGIVVRTVPQMNVFAVGLPLKLLVGMVLLATITTPTLIEIFSILFREAWDAMEDAMLGLRPA